ncbi:D-alanyl-D-alanine carboxypeptidase family protein [Brevibacillus massiliensis]|uniref:D-alanyl-D-alanine carboxypeptidase family protein n=1 Tax=Brevibacillus massiliensis TaxID=1118054 RepID=UPI000302FAA2|nr:D-alanyl-D-alanine carboxypeptidase family protein [Brevibacillus massiliensis]
MGQIRDLFIPRRPPAAKYDQIRLDRTKIHEGHLILVNRQHPVKQSGTGPNLLPVSAVQAVQLPGAEISLEKTCLERLGALLHACRARDRIVIVSGYRSKKEQEELYETSLQENGAVFTASYVARPGESEHQTGLAVDVGENAGDVDFICPSFPDYGVCQTFKQLAAEYGFIQRYKADKEHITHIACEPWHFRYVGYPHSAIIEQRGFSLEEYTEFLKQYTFDRGHLFMETDRSLIEIYYVPAEQGTTAVPVNPAARNNLSGNNQNGFVVTAFHPKGSEDRGR